jgi:FtsH-binding integral membrane protein
MNVPPFIPEPIEIPGNVSEERRAVCLAFVRRTATYHFLSVLFVAGIAFIPVEPLPLEFSGSWIVAMLLLLSLIRGLAKGKALELWLSVGISPALLIVLGLAARVLWDTGQPVWAPAVGLFFSLVYTWVSRRDHSFVGQYVLSLIASSIFIAVVERSLNEPAPMVATALIANGAFLFYVVYDSAAVLTRRRKGEELAAVVDLYRDFLNGLTYSVRVWRHWQKHKIWSLPPR